MKVKIILENEETPEEARELLKKALETAEEESSDVFADPIMEHSADRIKSIYLELQKEMFQEINEVLSLYGV